MIKYLLTITAFAFLAGCGGNHAEYYNGYDQPDYYRAIQRHG